MTIGERRVVVGATVFLLLLWPLSLAKEIPKAEEQKKESTTKDSKVASTSYVYSKSGNGPDAFDHLGPARFRTIHGLNSGLNFPSSSRSFNFPTKYRVGSFAGVGSGIGGISSDFGSRNLALSHGIGKKSFGPGISNLEADDLGGSLGLNRYGPSTFDLAGHEHEHEHEHEHGHEEKHREKGEKYAEEHESSGEKEGSKGYKVAEEFEKGSKGKKEKGEQSGQYQEEAATKKAHEDEEKKYKEKEESARAAKGEHFANSEGHKKGHKTTGYHNVYHKDEYKKDTTFYDDEHVDAQQEQYSHEDEKHARAEAEHKKVENLDAAYEQAEKAKEGLFTNGHQYGHQQAHDREEAVKEHHENDHDSHHEAKHKSDNEEAHSSHSHR